MRFAGGKRCRLGRTHVMRPERDTAIETPLPLEEVRPSVTWEHERAEGPRGAVGELAN